MAIPPLITEFLPRALRHLYVHSGVRRLLPHPIKHGLRLLWVRTARAIGYPVSSPQLPRPPLVPHRARMALSTVLFACDLNPDYLDFWPSTRHAWQQIVGIDPVLVLIAHAHEVPAALQGDPAIIPFAPVEGVHTTLQAQCIRLLYPALLQTDGAVMIADIDLFPLRRAYFHDPVERLDARFFVSYRDNRLSRGEIDIMFNAAAPATWAEIFDVTSPEDVRRWLAEWGAREYDGRRGWEGWYTDQELLCSKLLSWPEASARLWMLDDDYCRYNRLDRLELVHEKGLSRRRRRGIMQMKYSDYNCFVPYREHREINELVLRLGLEAARRRPGRRHFLPTAA